MPIQRQLLIIWPQSQHQRLRSQYWPTIGKLARAWLYFHAFMHQANVSMTLSCVASCWWRKGDRWGQALQRFAAISFYKFYTGGNISGSSRRRCLVQTAKLATNLLAVSSKGSEPQKSEPYLHLNFRYLVKRQIWGVLAVMSLVRKTCNQLFRLRT